MSDRREWELPHLREAHQMPVSIVTFSKTFLVLPFLLTGLFLMDDLFRELEAVCTFPASITNRWSNCRADFWSVKFYPYTEPGVDPVFAVVGGNRASSSFTNFEMPHADGMITDSSVPSSSWKRKFLQD